MLAYKCQQHGYQKIRKERLSNVDYIYYSLITLGILLLCMYLARIPGHLRLGSNQAALADRAKRRREKARSKSLEDRGLSERHALILKRGVSNIPTPWGWPGHEDNVESHHKSGFRTDSTAREPHSVSESLHRWVDRLVSEKQNVENQEYVLKKDASVRALLEDRYGRASRMSEINYKKTRAPLLRDPNLPHDQMDNFPSGRGEKIISTLDNQPGQPDNSEFPLPDRSSVELGEVRTPWGW